MYRVCSKFKLALTIAVASESLTLKTDNGRPCQLVSSELFKGHQYEKIVQFVDVAESAMCYVKVTNGCC